ncbi:hypothetical protein ABY58_12685 [Edwardsiella ictaluri]|nr:hypothetical protein ABY58_12685 [Edwardsiella ictaluri]
MSQADEAGADAVIDDLTVCICRYGSCHLSASSRLVVVGDLVHQRGMQMLLRGGIEEFGGGA